MEFNFDTNLDLKIPHLRVPTVAPPAFSPSSDAPKVEACKFPPYIKTLHDLTSSIETDSFIRWAGNGLYMYIVDADRLCEELERGKYFRSSKFASVIRNLNYHRFKKMRFEDLDINLRYEVDYVSAKFPEASRHLFYHPNFQSGRLDLLSNIKSKTRNPKESALVCGFVGGNHVPMEEKPMAPVYEAENEYLKRLLSQKDSEITMLRAQLALASGQPIPGPVQDAGNKRPRSVAPQAFSSKTVGGEWGDFLIHAETPEDALFASLFD